MVARDPVTLFSGDHQAHDPADCDQSQQQDREQIQTPLSVRNALRPQLLHAPADPPVCRGEVNDRDAEKIQAENQGPPPVFHDRIFASADPVGPRQQQVQRQRQDQIQQKFPEQRFYFRRQQETFPVPQPGDDHGNTVKKEHQQQV